MTKQETKDSVIIVVGKDKYLRSQEVRKLERELLGDGEGEIGASRFDGKTADVAAVLDDVRTLPFFAKQKVVIVADADPFIKANRPVLEKYFDNPPPEGTLILVCDTWLKNTKLAKKVPKIGKIIEAKPIEKKEILQWVVSRAREMGKTISRTAAQDMTNIIGTESGRIINELKKLALFVGERKEITASDIELLCGPTAEHSVFAINDMLADGNTAEALKIMNRVIANDRSAEFTMVGAMNFSLGRLLRAKVMIDAGFSEWEVAKECKVFYDRDRFFNQVKRFNKNRLKKLLNDLAKLDYKTKIGLGRGRINLEKFIVCAGEAS